MEGMRQLVERHLLRPIIPEGEDRPVVCIVCDDSGWERFTDVLQREWARRCVCRTSLPLQIANCPEEFNGKRLDDMTLADPVRARMAAWVPRGLDLYLHGLTGVGKTRMACALVTEIRKPARFELVDVLLRELVKQDEDGELWKTLVNVPVLILDDILVADTDWSRRTLTTLYTERLSRKKRTVFTSNRSPRDLTEAWQDERLTSRIAGAADVVKLEGADYRKEQFRRNRG